MRLGCWYGGAVSGWESGALLGLSDESATGVQGGVGESDAFSDAFSDATGRGCCVALPSAGREDAGEAELLLPIAREGIVAAQRGGAEREGSGAATPWGRGAGWWRGR